MPWLNKRWILFFAASIAILITIISILGWRNYQDGVSKQNYGHTYGVDPDSQDYQNELTNWTASDTALSVFVIVDSFDPGRSGNTLGFRLQFRPLNQLYSANNSIADIAPVLPVRLVLGTTTVDLPANTAMADRSITQVLDGDVNKYPFDDFYMAYNLAAFTSGTNPLPLTVYVFGTVQGFTVDSWFVGLTEDGSQVQVVVVIKRSDASKVFAIIIFLVMWGLSISISIAATSVWFREKKVELPLIAISTALLFALPNVRNSQPGIPAVAGTTSDMVGFFWNILFVALSAISLLAKYVLQNQRERPVSVAPPDATGSGIMGEVTPLSGVFFHEK